MSCPEGTQMETNLKNLIESPSKNVPSEGVGNIELSSYKNPKTWKKSITNLFRHQLRSTKSNDVSYPYIHTIIIYRKRISSYCFTMGIDGQFSKFNLHYLLTFIIETVPSVDKTV